MFKHHKDILYFFDRLFIEKNFVTSECKNIDFKIDEDT